MSERQRDLPEPELSPPITTENVLPQEVPVKPGKKLTRVPFTVSRLVEYCTRRELVNQTGHDEQEWPLVVLKELVDNAIDAAEEGSQAT